MSTASARVSRALRLLRVTDAGEALDADIAADALTILNNMLADWEGAGFGFVSPAYASLTTADTLPQEDWEAVSANLAVLLAPEFEVEPPPVVVAAATSLLARLVTRYSKPTY